MDNLKIWIYLIIGLIYLISRFSKKTKEVAPGKNRQNPSMPSENVPKPLTFEELLREITEAKEQPPVLKPATEYVDYDDEVAEEKEPERPDYDYRKQETYKTFEQSKYEAFNRLSYEETLKVEDTDVRFGKFKVFEEEKQPSIAAQIADDFSDQDKVRRAFIMSEIFNRKYA